MTSTALRFVVLWPTMLLGAGVDIPGYEGETRIVIEHALHQYRSAASYADTLVARLEIHTDGGSLPTPPNAGYEFTFAFSRPYRIALETKMYSVFCDGQTLWEHIDREQYTKRPAPTRLALEDLQLAQFSFYKPIKHPLAWVLTGADPFKDGPFDLITRFGTTVAESLGGRPGKRLQASAKLQVGPEDFVTVPVGMWFSDATGLLEEIRYDHTEPYQARLGTGPGAPKITRVAHVLRFENIRRDVKIPDDRFVFKPGQYDQELPRFRMVTDEAYQMRLIGRPAPDFTGKDLEGKDLKLSDFAGRVLLLDFWSMGCGPCIVAMPGLQALADAYAGKPVSLIGVNGDPPAAEKRVLELLKQRSIKYRHLKDPEIRVFEAYRISPIPCLFIIDKTGTIQAILLGYRPGGEPELARRIDALLRGESLIAPATLSAP